MDYYILLIIQNAILNAQLNLANDCLRQRIESDKASKMAKADMDYSQAQFDFQKAQFEGRVW